MKTFAEKVIQVNKNLRFDGVLPGGIQVMNPFRDREAFNVSSAFYNKYYSDFKKRFLILGINPGRFGAGLTGIPFTDPKRLIGDCGIPYSGKPTHEPSSVFIYEMIKAYGGTQQFYSQFYINSLSPLGFTASTPAGNVVNYNYYDSEALRIAVTPFIIKNITTQIKIGTYTDTCVCFGTGKNEQFLQKLNQQYGFFSNIVALEHPRYIMQYQSKNKQFYIDKYLTAFERITNFQKNL